jgi:hypothetical protein
MRALTMVALFAAGPAFGQGLTPTTLSPFGTPGTPVGAASPVGQRAPNVGMPVGQRVGQFGGSSIPGQAPRPEGQLVDLKNLAAPLTAPLPPELRPDTDSFIDKAYQKWRDALGLGKPMPPANTWTPGLSRRNRERHKFNWWYD